MRIAGCEGWLKAKMIDGGIEFSNGVKITDHHYQECCENVYADWSSLNNTDFENTNFYNPRITFIEGVGFRINSYTVHCYNEQNGYYSSDLSLIVAKNGKRIQEINISNCLKNIDTE